MRTLLEVDRVTRIYGEKVLFNKISLHITEGQKVALIAKNGSGKTTLLNIIAGIEGPDEGTITLNREINTEYLFQNPVLVPENTIFEEVYNTRNEINKAIKAYEKALIKGNEKDLQKTIEQMDRLNAWEYDTKIKQILTILKVTELDKKINTLSGGQQKRVALAKLLISSPDLLILDEPTNHLDVEMIEWLEEYLSQSNITLLMVTHDRYFLDRVCNEILELDSGNIYRYEGNYTYFLKKKDERMEIAAGEVEKAKNLLRKEQDWMNRMPKARGTKAKYRIDNYYELKSKAENGTRNEKMNISIEASRMGKKILVLKDICYKWDDLKILDGFTYTFSRYEKIGIIGKNGAGKSTFLDVITEKLKPRAGILEMGETIKFGYYKQEGIIFDENTKVIDIVREIADVVKIGNGESISAAAFLNYFMFPYPTHHQLVSKLSGGEKRRLYLVTVLMQSPNFLILDEPTNDLDIITLQVLEDYLASFNGCVIVVSHDRYFMDKIVDHLFVFKGNGIIKDFPGNYTIYKDYEDQIKREESIKTKPTSTRKEKNDQTQTRKLTYKERIELEALEKEIELLEKEKKVIETELNSGGLNAQDLHTKSTFYGDLLKKLDQKTDRWLELSEL
ncbi:MAG: ABC-F family ATP-binding cassette domain-containing protein [Bacteroidales bacterium]|nr:ABC-F family ATP-binding cassette domain-containing protein [Bacteroidales bacterium]